MRLKQYLFIKNNINSIYLMKIKTMSYKYSKNTLTIPKKSEVKKYI